MIMLNRKISFTKESGVGKYDNITKSPKGGRVPLPASERKVTKTIRLLPETIKAMDDRGLAYGPTCDLAIKLFLAEGDDPK